MTSLSSTSTRPTRRHVEITVFEGGADSPHRVRRFVEGRIDNWRRRLIDLSHRNRLIAYKPTKATTLEVVAPAIGELMDFERRRVWDFYFPPDPDEVDYADASDTAETLDE